MLADRYTTTLHMPTTADRNAGVVFRAFAAQAAGPETWAEEHDELFSADLVGHFAGMPPIDSRTHLQLGLAAFEGFADLERLVEDLLADGDRVVARWTTRGTHTGEFMGIPATGRFVTTSGITIFRLEDGLIVEEWSESDTFGLLQQLGALGGDRG